jgi:hypothetical protein|tara:strand:+ start:142 stop:378 length:237 start_codon:yes stop_codon:yes gene_type:complete
VKVGVVVSKIITSSGVKVGDLVTYEFRTARGGSEFRTGLVVSLASSFGPHVWKIRGLDGCEYTIHKEHLNPLNTKERQ